MMIRDKNAPKDGRNRILQSAMQLFAERGFRGVSISDVAKSAGLVKSAIYHHFENKESLYLAVLSETVHASRLQMDAGASGETWKERLRGAVYVLGELAGPRTHVLSLVLGGMTQLPANDARHLLEQITPLRREFAAVVRREIEAGIAAGELRPIDPELVALCLIGLVLASLQSLGPGTERERVDFAFEIFLRGCARAGFA